MGTAFIVGPVFFTILKNADKYGTKAGIITATGIIISDILVVFICSLFAANLVEQYVHLPIVKWLAAAILTFLGIRFLSNPNKADQESSHIHVGKGYFISFYQGFLVNFVNPFVFVIWIGFIALGHSSTDTVLDYRLFLMGILVGIYATDIAKAIGTKYIMQKLKSNIVSIIYRVLGFALLLMAARLILMALEII